MPDRPRVGEILVAAGIIDEMQLKSALGEQSRWGRRLGVTLIKMGMVEEGHLIRALAKQLDLPVASLAGKRIPAEVIAHVPARVASEHGVIPLFTKETERGLQLFLGMEDPSNLAVLDDLSFRTGMEVLPVMVGPTELSQALDRYYHGSSVPGPQTTTYRPGDTIGVGSLRVVTDDTAQPGTQPIEEAEDVPKESSAPDSATPVAKAAPTDVPQQTRDAEEGEAELELIDLPPVALPDGLLEDVATAVDETERTRIVAKAIAQLLIEKGVLNLAELQKTIADLKAPKQDAAKK